MTEPTALALLRDAESYLSALHGSVARHDNLGADLTCGGCKLRDQIASALPLLAAEQPPADRAAVLREAADEIAGIDFHPNARARSLDIAAGLARRLRRLADEAQP